MENQTIVSTHSRTEAAAYTDSEGNKVTKVSTHSRTEAAAGLHNASG